MAASFCTVAVTVGCADAFASARSFAPHCPLLVRERAQRYARACAAAALAGPVPPQHLTALCRRSLCPVPPQYLPALCRRVPP